MEQNQPQIITVRELLTNDRKDRNVSLKIPSYQRPYKWTAKNVNQLIDDVLIHKEKSEYRLGTLVVHNEDNISHIVDGQQRTITLTLIAYAIIQKPNKTPKEEKALENFELKLSNLSFTSNISKANIQNNYKQIERRIADFDEKLISFFLGKCTLVEVVVNDISEAFQFFDSQNSRGKDLEPHDLLKAFHLREMSNSSTQEERKKIVEKWEKIRTTELSELFSEYLFRIRNWSRGNSARYFSKNEVDIFKGVSLNTKESYPFAEMLRIANEMGFPFQIDETIINGKRFFEMIEHYQVMIDKNIKSNPMSEESEGYRILETIKTYAGSFRTGDGYIRNLFNCGLIYYIDKFGKKDLSKAVVKIFIWAYSLRLKLKRVQLSSIDNFALNKGHSQIQLFKKIKEAIKPSDILNVRLETLKKNESTKTEEIVNLFKELKYYE